MSKFKIINLVDKLFITISVFLIIYAWINFYTRDLWTTFIFSLVFTFSIMFIFSFFIGKKQARVKLNKKQTEDINIYFYSFKLNSTKQKLELLKNTLSKNFNVTIKNNHIYYQESNKKIVLVLAEHFEILDNNVLIKTVSEFNEENVDEIHIICNETTNNLNKNLFTNKTIKIINKKDLYLNYFLKYGSFPNTENINFSSQKFSFRIFFKTIFLPTKAKRYFFCGLILIFSSILLPFHFYYLVIGSILLMFALICKVLPMVKD